MLLLSLFGLFYAMFIGFTLPKFSGWLVLIFFPILGAASFTIIPSDTIPLTFTRVSIMVTLGIVLRRYGNLPPRYLLNSFFGKLMLLFTILLLLSSTRDSYFYHIIISHIPNLFMSFLIGYVVIRDEGDMYLLVKVFVWQAALIGFFIILEYFGDFSIGKILSATNPNFDIEQIRDKNFNAIFRSGFYRVSGLDNNSVNTGYRLAFLFPIVLWYSFQKQNKIIKIIPLALVLAGLFLLQTRAAFLSVLISMLFLVLFLSKNKTIGLAFKFRNLIQVLFLLLFVTTFILTSSPSLWGIVSEFLSKTMVLSVAGDDVSVINKFNRLPTAYSFFISSPFLGYGSTLAVYYNLMFTEDLPGVIAYFLAGGVVLGSLFIYIHSYMPYILFKISKMSYINKNTKLLLIYSSCAYIAGFLCVFSNFVETHFWIMYIMFGAIYKTYFLSVKHSKNFNRVTATNFQEKINVLHYGRKS